MNRLNKTGTAVFSYCRFSLFLKNLFFSRLFLNIRDYHVDVMLTAVFMTVCARVCQCRCQCVCGCMGVICLCCYCDRSWSYSPDSRARASLWAQKRTVSAPPPPTTTTWKITSSKGFIGKSSWTPLKKLDPLEPWKIIVFFK